ncbi:MAG: RNA polymerase sigma factor [Candidatus Eisenbacteria bacterium]|nr:RNA polymerase sigma factor [Candidatus Eisenbacteria bacterium]
MGRDGDTLVDQHKDLVYHVINRMIPDPQYHDDLFQETFLNVARSMPTFRRESKLSTWIYRVAQNTCLSHIRRMRGDPAYSLDEWREEDLESQTIPAIADKAEEGERRTTLDHALDRLPLKYRMPVTLYYLEELSYREIAACLAIPMGTVKTNIHRGLMRLRTVLGEDPDAHL